LFRLNKFFQFEEDVAAEFNRIKNADLKQLSKKEMLIVNDVVMKFKKKKTDFYAVNHISFGVQNTECFGLLGLNGAGMLMPEPFI
jgi:ABC-type uncharacterized transport system ATPase subunit